MLEVADLACRRAGRLVFAGVGFRLEVGGALAVIGRNGAGKSTLLAVLAGLLRPDAGRIAYRGEDGPGGEHAHLLGHRDGLKASLTSTENLRFAAALFGATTDFSIADALARVGLAGAGDLPTGYLSAGQRRRLTLARLIVAPRPLWLLDEPTSALDAQGQILLGDLMAEHRSNGGIVVAATHAPLPLPQARTLLLDQREAATA